MIDLELGSAGAVDGVDAAVDCANDNEYGLSAAVFGGDIARAMNVARRI